MGTPANKNADTQENELEDDNSSTSFTDKVNEAVKQMKKNDKGVYELPADLPEEVRVAALAEKRYRDTQSAYTKTNQKLRTVEAEKSILLKKATENVTVELTKEQEEELEELKFSDPEAWRKKLNRYESEAVHKKQKLITEEVQSVSAKGLEESELEERRQILTSFKEEYPDFELDDDVIANDIPPRLTNKLAKGELTFEQFLHECHDYLNKGKVVKEKEEPARRPNLSKLGGGSKPDDNAKAEDDLLSYATEVY